MKERIQNSERGQALVLIVFSIVALLGFTALAVDGGMLYADRRHAQNSADAASLAGGGMAALLTENNRIYYDDWNCSGALAAVEAEAKARAITRAADNGFTIDTDISDANGVTTTCNVVNHTSYVDKYMDVETYIKDQTDTAFAHFVFGGLLENRVQSVTRIRPRTHLAFGNAVVSVNPTSCSGNTNGVQLRGNNTIHINGGGIYSNGCLDTDGGAITQVDNGTVVFLESGGQLNNITPAPTQVTSRIPDDFFSAPPPDCTGLPTKTQSGSVLEPGIYTDIRLNNGSLHLNPGLYCITGSTNAIKVTGGTFTADRVTLYVMNGDVTINGGDHQLTAPPTLPDPVPAIPGMLIYLPVGNTGPVSLSGNNDSYYLGTIYAPSALIGINGTSGTHPTFNTQIIGLNVDVGGTADIDINFTGGQTYTKPSRLDLYR